MLIDTRFEDAHWNRNAACMIPAAWVASVMTRHGQIIMEVRWHTEAGAVEMAQNAFPSARLTD